jgi:hypothetical protein
LFDETILTVFYVVLMNSMNLIEKGYNNEIHKGSSTDSIIRVPGYPIGTNKGEADGNTAGSVFIYHEDD